MPKFDLSKVAKHTGGRTPIKERGIQWNEHYHEKSAGLKEKFDEELGPGGYFRWEGHDTTTNSDYYVVVGPSIHSGMGKAFFAGVKRLPPPAEREGKTYSPYGEYFRTMRAALGYANEKWGIPTPRGTPNYTQSNLQNVEISRHVKG